MFQFKRISSKFTAILLPPVIVSALLLLYVLNVVEVHQRADLADRIARAAVSAEANAFAIPLWNLDQETLRNLFLSARGSKQVACIAIVEDTGSMQDLSDPDCGPQRSGLLVRSGPITLESIGRKDVIGTLYMGFIPQRLVHAENIVPRAMVGLAILLMGLITALVLLANRVTVGTPLLRVRQSMRLYRKSGKRHPVDWDTRDELGQLIREYNATLKQQEELEASLVSRLRTEALLSRLSANLISTNHDELPDHLTATLAAVGRFTRSSECQVLVRNPDDESLETLYCWSDKEDGLVRQCRLIAADHGWLMAQLTIHQVIRVADAASLPEAGMKVARQLCSGRIVALLGVPLFSPKGVIGCLLLYTVDDPNEWRDQDVRLAGVTGNLISQSIQRFRTGEELQAEKQELVRALEQLKQAQDNLVEAETLASLGRLVAGVAHEINTPLGAALTVATGLEARVGTFRESVIDGKLKRSSLDHFCASVDDASRMLHRNLASAARLVGSFKQIAVDQTSHTRRRFKVTELIEEILFATIRPKIKHSSISIVTRIEDDLLMDSYPGPFGQVVTNLIENAITHAYGDSNSGEILVQAYPEKDDMVMKVIDHGAGIDESNQRQIFLPFFTTRLGEGGSGLGLNVVYNIVTQVMGGTILVDSTPKVGSTFVVRVPLAAPVATGESQTG